MCVHKHISEPK